MFGEYLNEYLRCPERFVQVIRVRQLCLQQLSLNSYDYDVNIFDEVDDNNFGFKNIKSLSKYFYLIFYCFFNV